MSLPEELQHAADMALQAMRAHPRHHLVLYYRYRIYQILKGFNGSQPLPKPPRALAPDSLGDRVRGWLAIMTAEKVLPIFTGASYGAEVPNRELEWPKEMLEMAYGLMRSTTDPQEAFHEAAAFHHEFGFLVDEYEYDPVGFPLNASLAGWTTKLALSETLGGYWIDWRLEDEARFAYQAEEPVRIDINKSKLLWEAREWVGPPIDTAGDAAIAYSCSNSSPVCEPAKLEEFWTWWLTEALPEAWAKASRTASDSEV